MEIVVFSLGVLSLVLAFLAAATPLARWIGLPLPIVLAAAGLGYGLSVDAFGLKLEGVALDTYDIWFVQQLALDSHAMLYVFLPPLLFEMALSVEVRRLLDDVGAVLVMAILAVVTATLAIGFAVHVASWFTIIPLGLVACLMLGAAVSTTDPAAVITTFRELGAPRRLLVILEGESLLNDAAAIAIFTLLLTLAGAAEPVGPLGVVAGFLYSFIGGGAVGVAMAFVASRFYPLLGRSRVAETSLTVALAYGSYLAAELLIGASGVVAVVCAGLATGSAGFVRMGPRNWSSVRTVWTQIGFWASSLILLIVSSLAPSLIGVLTLKQGLMAVIVYLAAIAARALILFAGLPLLGRAGFGARIETDQKLLILWGGVRGAVTLVLALSLTEIDALGDEAHIVGALAAIFTLSTLFLNASTLALVTRKLGLDQLSPADQALRDLILAGAMDKVRNSVAELVAERGLSESALAELDAEIAEQRSEAEAEILTSSERIPFGERLRLGLAILAGQEARLVRRAFEEGAIGPRATNLLRLTAERIADGARLDGRDGYEEASELALQQTRGYRLAFLLHRFVGFDVPLRNVIEFRLTSLLETERVLRDLDRYARRTLPSMIGDDATANLRDALKMRLSRVEEEAASLARQYPNYASALERTLILRAALRRERHEYERLFNDGVIGQELFDDLQSELRRRERVLDRPPRLDLTLSPLVLLDRSPVFNGLTEGQRRRLAERLKVRVARPGDMIATRGARQREMVFVASGALEQRGDSKVLRLSNGDVFGQAALLKPGRRSDFDVISLGFSRLLTLAYRDFKLLAIEDPALADQLESRLEDLGRPQSQPPPDLKSAPQSVAG